MTTDSPEKPLSPWWRHAVILVMAFGFSVLTLVTVLTYTNAPPIPVRVTDPADATLFTREDIEHGQEVFFKYGLMEHGTLWGHGAYLGPDYSAQYLHTLSADARNRIAQDRHHRDYESLGISERGGVDVDVQRTLKENRYDAGSGILTFTPAEVQSYRKQIAEWTSYFARPTTSAGLPARYISDSGDLSQLTAFFAWTAWASVVNRPGKAHSYTNNFPYDPAAGNTPTSDAILWSALSLIALLAGTAAVLFVFGKFDYLGWKSPANHVHPQMLPGVTTNTQRATIKYFVIAALLFLVQVLVGGATAHYRADPAGFYGTDISGWLPSNILRTWHLQLAIFWIATGWDGGRSSRSSPPSGRWSATSPPCPPANGRSASSLGSTASSPTSSCWSSALRLSSCRTCRPAIFSAASSRPCPSSSSWRCCN